MPESLLHQSLVREIANWVSNEFPLPDLITFVDLPTCNTSERPMKLGNFIPDLYAHSRLTNLTIVGEAKTPHDLVTKRSERQIRGFLESLSYESGGQLILATEWHLGGFAKGLMRRLKRETMISNVNTHVLECIMRH